MLRGILFFTLFCTGLANVWAQQVPSQSNSGSPTLDLPVDKLLPGAELKKPPGPPKDDHQGDDKPPTVFGQEIKSEDNTLIYVLDISGSMGWDMAAYTKADGSTANGNRLDRAKAELVKSINSLPENFKFNIIAYDCQPYPWSLKLEKADPKNKKIAEGWVYSQEPQGGTDTKDAVIVALKQETKLVILLTDGAPNCPCDVRVYTQEEMNQQHLEGIMGARKEGQVINVYGIGATNIMKVFCMSIAQATGGTYTDVR